MPFMTQTQMQELISGGSTIFDDRGIDILTAHLPSIAVAVLGTDANEFRTAVTRYADEMEQVMQEVIFLNEPSQNAAIEYIARIREMASR